jgi:hypothetical protein
MGETCVRAHARTRPENGNFDVPRLSHQETRRCRAAPKRNHRNHNDGGGKPAAGEEPAAC